MYRGNSSRIFPIILVIVVIAIAVAALVSIGRVIFNGGGNQQPEVDLGKQALLTTDAGHSVRMTVRGPIVADEDFRSYRISVDANTRDLTTYSGYLDQPIDSKTLSNNTQAYEQFVYALDRANLVKGTAFEGDKDDTRGICATGRVYEFEVINAGSTVKRLWTSTCKGSPGSFKGSVTQVQNLFLQQIPDNRDLLKVVKL